MRTVNLSPTAFLWGFIYLVLCLTSSGCQPMPPMTEGKIIDMYTKVRTADDATVTRQYFLRVQEEGGYNRTQDIEVSEQIYSQVQKDDRFVIPVRAEKPAATPAKT